LPAPPFGSNRASPTATTASTGASNATRVSLTIAAIPPAPSL
jgi:hypothetical protein